MLRSSKTFEIENDNQSLSAQRENYKDDMKDEIFSALNPQTSSPTNFGKNFRIKNNTKPFNSLNTSLGISNSLKHLHEKTDVPLSPPNKCIVKKNSGFSPNNSNSLKIKLKAVGNDDLEDYNSPKSQKTSNFHTSPANHNSDFKKNLEEKKEIENFELEEVKEIDEKHNSKINYQIAHPNQKKIIYFSPQNKKKKASLQKDNIKLDKETLRELNHYTDKNFIKSIKASFRKLEIIEKINEDNFKHEKTVERPTYLLTSKNSKRSSMFVNDTTAFGNNELNHLHENTKLPQIDSSPRKKKMSVVVSFKNH